MQSVYKLPSEIWTVVGQQLVSPFEDCLATCFWDKHELGDLRECQRSLLRLGQCSSALQDAIKPIRDKALVIYESAQLDRLALRRPTPSSLQTLLLARVCENAEVFNGHLNVIESIGRTCFYQHILPSCTALTSLALSTTFGIYPDILAPLLGLKGHLRRQLKDLRIEGILANDCWLDFIACTPAVTDSVMIARCIQPYSYEEDACTLIDIEQPQTIYEMPFDRAALPAAIATPERALLDWNTFQQYVHFNHALNRLSKIRNLPASMSPLALTRLSLNVAECRGCTSLDVFFSPAFANLKALRINAAMRRSGHRGQAPHLFSPYSGLSEILSINLAARSVSRAREEVHIPPGQILFLVKSMGHWSRPEMVDDQLIYRFSADELLEQPPYYGPLLESLVFYDIRT